MTSTTPGPGIANTNPEIQQDHFFRDSFRKFVSARNLIFLALSIFIIFFLVSVFDWEKIKQIVNDINAGYLAVGAAFYILSNILKTARFSYYFNDQKLDFKSLLKVVSYHNFFNQIMPARTGELTQIYYMKKICGINLSGGIHSLLATRFMDLVIVGVFFLISFVKTSGNRFPAVLLPVAGLIIILSLAAMFLMNRIVYAGYIFTIKSVNLTRLDRFAPVKKICEKLHELSDSFSSAGIAGRTPVLFITSALVWLALYSFSYCIIKGFSIDLTFHESVLGATAAVLTNILPINSIGSFGTMEAGWAGGYYLLGVDKNRAIISAFTYHIINFIIAALMAGAVYLVTKEEQGE